MVEKTSIEAQFRISNKRNNYVRMSGTYEWDEREKHINENRVDQDSRESTPRQSPYTGIGKLWV